MGPRPILKPHLISNTSTPNNIVQPPLPFASCSQYQFQQPQHSPHVHFPPTPALTRPGVTHSPNTYDRAPIVVLPNECEIPERGCRVYDKGEGEEEDHGGDDGSVDGGHPAGSSRRIIRPNDKQDRRRSTPCSTVGLPVKSKLKTGMVNIESYFHPRAFEACQLVRIEDEDGVGEGGVDDLEWGVQLEAPTSTTTNATTKAPPLPLIIVPLDLPRPLYSLSSSSSTSFRSQSESGECRLGLDVLQEQCPALVHLPPSSSHDSPISVSTSPLPILSSPASPAAAFAAAVALNTPRTQLVLRSLPLSSPPQPPTPLSCNNTPTTNSSVERKGSVSVSRRCRTPGYTPRLVKQQQQHNSQEAEDSGLSLSPGSRSAAGSCDRLAYNYARWSMNVNESLFSDTLDGCLGGF